MATTSPVRFGRIDVTSLGYYESNPKEKATIHIDLSGWNKRLAPLPGINEFTLILAPSDELSIQHSVLGKGNLYKKLEDPIAKEWALKLFNSMTKNVHPGGIYMLERLLKEQTESGTERSSECHRALAGAFPNVTFYNRNGDSFFREGYPALKAFDKALGTNRIPALIV
jgi:hypothetical protein